MCGLPQRANSYNGLMTQSYDVCVRGGGIVGCTLALHAAARRLRVAWVAATPRDPAHSDVRAYALSPASRSLLEAVGCWPEEQYATPVLSMQVEDSSSGRADGASRVVFDAQEQGAQALNWIVDTPVLEGLLTQAIAREPRITRCDPLSIDAELQAALTVVCEGRYGEHTARAQRQVRPYAQWALAARVRCSQAHGQVARQWFGAAEIVALLPLGGPQGRECALVWSLAPEQAHAWQQAPADVFCEALQAASHQALGRMELISERQVWPLQWSQAERWVGRHGAQGSAPAGAWLLAGDAAHTLHPLAGQGLNLGLGDVAELLHLMDTRPYWRGLGDMRLLRAYERARKTEFAQVGGACDALQQLFSQTAAPWPLLRRSGLRAFGHSGPLKRWVAQQAMGVGAQASTATSAARA